MARPIAVVGEASADLLTDVNAKAANKRAATAVVLYMGHASGGELGEGAMLPRGREPQSHTPDNSLDLTLNPAILNIALRIGCLTIK
jgi:hypothetical protein